MTADELLAQRKRDLRADDIREQRQIETLLIKFMANQDQQGFSPATRQRLFAAVRSFFEINYVPLRMRHGDYPQGESVGVRAATKEIILKAVTRPETGNNPVNNAIILTLKDSGLRASDAQLLNYGDIADGIERNANFIPITLVTKKKKIIAKTFIGKEAIDAIKESVEARRTGTRRIKPETITNNSPLFIAWNQNQNRISRTALSNIARGSGDLEMNQEETNKLLRLKAGYD
jgi:integrase